MRNCCDTGIRQPVPCKNYAVCPFQDSGRASSSRRSLSRAMVHCGTSQPRSSVFRTCTGDDLERNRGAPADACITSVDRLAKSPTPRKRIRTAQRLQAPQQGEVGNERVEGTDDGLGLDPGHIRPVYVRYPRWRPALWQPFWFWSHSHQTLGESAADPQPPCYLKFCAVPAGEG